jgi:hypothetical protein
VAFDGELVEEVGGRESARPEALADDSGSWSAATEDEEVVVLRVGSTEEEGVRQWCSLVNQGGGRERSRGVVQHGEGKDEKGEGLSARRTFKGE